MSPLPTIVISVNRGLYIQPYCAFVMMTPYRNVGVVALFRFPRWIPHNSHFCISHYSKFSNVCGGFLMRYKRKYSEIRLTSNTSAESAISSS